MPDSQIYSFFIDNGPGVEGTFIAKVRLDPNFRPKVGDSLTLGVTGEDFRVMRDEIPLTAQVLTRITEDGLIRITEDDRNRILEQGSEEEQSENSTHNYFVQPANNPRRISTWTQSGFANDRTLDQLFR